MKNMVLTATAAGSLALGAPPATAQESVNLLLNWRPGADHAPIFYALDQGWYDEAGIELSVDTGQGSGTTAQNVGMGATDLGIAELGTAFLAHSQNADLVAVMAIYANSPFTLYWKKSTGIEGPEDFPGHTLGNPSGDAARIMWPAFAEEVGIPQDAVNFVNISAAAKVPTLAADRVDIISDFWNGHDLKVNEFGEDLGFVRWSEIGLNPYGNSIIVSGEFLEANEELVADFVNVTQRAYAACVEDSAPCIDALLANASGLERGAMEDQWARVTELMTTEATTTEALGWFDPERIQQTYELVETYFELDEPFDPETAYTNRFLNTDVKMSP